MQSWPLTVDRILDHAASASPEAEIVTASAAGPPKRSSYAEFARRVAELGGALAASGVRPGDVVDVIGANGLRQLEAWYAIAGVGAVCHPLSPGLSPTRTGALMRDGGAKVALIDPGLLGRLEPVLLKLPHLQRIVALSNPHETLDTRMQGVVSLEAFLKEHPGRPGLQGPDEQAPALLVRTAGASGPPKGVIWTHRTCVLQALAVQACEAMALSAEDVLLVLAPFWRAAAWGMVFAAPMAGARLALPGPKTDAQSVRILADREAATVILASPAELQALHEQFRAEGRRPNGLKRAIAVGAPCPPALARAWRDSFGVEVRSAWGAVEIGGVGAAGAGVASLRPCFGVELQVRTRSGGAAGDAPGRLWARGPASADSEASDHGFVDTGDLAVLDREGRVSWLGRAEDQVRGPDGRQPAWPLEAAAYEHPSTARAAAIDPVAGLAFDGPILLVERKASAVTGKAEYLKFLGDRLAARAPAEVLFVDGFPLDAAGRIDKRVLRERLERVSAPAAAPPVAEAAPDPEPDAAPSAPPAPAEAVPPASSPEPAQTEPAPALAAAAVVAPVLYQAEAEHEAAAEAPASEPEAEPGPDTEPPAAESPEPEAAAAEPPAAEAPAEPAPAPSPPDAPEPAASDPDPELRLAEAPADAAPVEEPGLFLRLEPRPARARARPDARQRSDQRAGLFLIFTALLAAAPVVMILAAGLGVRLGLIDWRIGINDLILDLPSKLALIGVLGGVLAIFAASSASGRRHWLGAILSLGLPIAVLAALLWIRSVGGSYPPIHDVATDWSDPVSFSPALMRERGPEAYPVEADPVVPPSAGVYMNRRVADVNAETCPGAVPVDLPFPPDQAYLRARTALIAQGLKPVTDDPRHGRLEATATGLWLGFKQDVAVRVKPGRGSLSSRIDVRSTSRSGLWDFGANCQRVTRLVQALGGGSPDQGAGA